MNNNNKMNLWKANNRRVRDKKRKWIYENISDCCMLCGYDKCGAALELHHTRETELTIKRRKSKKSNGSGSSMSWNDLKTDAPHMVLLCANCHREVHNGMHPEIPVPEHMATMERSKGTAPYGWDWKDGILVKNPKTFEIRQRIISLNNGGLNYSQISRLLNDEGIVTKRQRKWAPRTVSRICRGCHITQVENI